ncbi:MAG TPA: hypothetical protein V6D17_16130 [Candidatus Obscuribacterales bacterium]
MVLATVIIDAGISLDSEAAPASANNSAKSDTSARAAKPSSAAANNSKPSSAAANNSKPSSAESAARTPASTRTRSALSPVKTKMRDGWLVLFECIGQGKCRAKLSFYDAKMETGVFESFVVKPDYHLVQFTNPDNKTRYAQDIDSWARTVRSQEFLNFIKNCKKKRIGTAKLCGLNCTSYQCLDSNGSPRAEFHVTRQIRLSRELEEALCRHTTVPPGFGMPVEMRIFARFGRPPITTVKILSWKKAQFPESEFRLPKHFHKVNRIEEVWLASDGVVRDADLQDFFEYRFPKDQPRK